MKKLFVEVLMIVFAMGSFAPLNTEDCLHKNGTGQEWRKCAQRCDERYSECDQRCTMNSDDYTLCKDRCIDRFNECR